MKTKSEALSIPALYHNQIQLEDGSVAKILWLYNESNNGLLLPLKGKKLDANHLEDLFEITNSDRPIPVLVDVDQNLSQYLYKRVKIQGKVVTTSSKHFEALPETLNPFLINYLGNCFRPFSNNDGFLAMDLRRPLGKIESLETIVKPFPIIYTVQGIISVDIDKANKKLHDLLLRICFDAIPDRQGMDPAVSSMGQQSHNVYSILTIGEINWQFIHEPLTFAAYVNIDAANTYDYQSKLTKLAYHWQVWQKNCRLAIRKTFSIEPKIRPLICSNSSNEKQFHPNGLQLPTEIEQKLLSQEPSLRRSIDWLGISTGKLK